jgi:hypothetical protein
MASAITRGAKLARSAAQDESITLEVMLSFSGLSAVSVEDNGCHYIGAQDLLQWRLGEINLTFGEIYRLLTYLD